MPESASLELTMPPCFEELRPNTYAQLVETEMKRREKEIANEMQQTGKIFMGMKVVMKQGFSDRPRNPEPRTGLNPKLAAKNKWLRIDAIQRHKQFVSDYWNALKEWKNGNRDVFFPPGTYALQRYTGVNVQPG